MSSLVRPERQDTGLPSIDVGNGDETVRIDPYLSEVGLSANRTHDVIPNLEILSDASSSWALNIQSNGLYHFEDFIDLVASVGPAKSLQDSTRPTRSRII